MYVQFELELQLVGILFKIYAYSFTYRSICSILIIASVSAPYASYPNKIGITVIAES